MQRYEYKILAKQRTDLFSIDQLNTLGKEGWLVCNLINDSTILLARELSSRLRGIKNKPVVNLATPAKRNIEK